MPGHDASGKRNGARRAALDHSLPLEERLAEARKLRAKALGVPLERLDDAKPRALRASLARQAAPPPVQRPPAAAPRPDQSGQHWWRGVALAPAGRMMLVFAAAVGLGFGAVLGMARVTDRTEIPVPDGPKVADSGAMPVAVAGVEHTSFQWSGAFTDDDLIEKLEGVSASGPGPQVWTASLAMRPPDAAPDAGVTMPQIEGVRYASRVAAIGNLSLAYISEQNGLVVPFRSGMPLDGQLSGLPRQVFIHAPTGTSGRLLEQISDELAVMGVEVARIGREGFRISQTHIRYYSAGMAAPAQAMADALEIEARDFSETTRPTDRIELWVAGRAPTEPAREDDRPSNPLAWLLSRL
jgi:hypothetical protein